MQPWKKIQDSIFSVGKNFLNKAQKATARKKTTNQFYSTKGDKTFT